MRAPILALFPCLATGWLGFAAGAEAVELRVARPTTGATVAALTVLGRENELRLHLRGALNAGLGRKQITEMMIHLAHYGGWPVGVTGLRIAKEVFDAADAAGSGTVAT